MQTSTENVFMDMMIGPRQSKLNRVGSGRISLYSHLGKREDTISESLRVSTPAWPLQTTVAVNPFWNLRHHQAHEVFEDTPSVIHASMLMPVRFYLEKLKNGEISRSALQQSLDQCRTIWPHLPGPVDEFVSFSERTETHAEFVRSFAEVENLSRDWSSVVVQEVGKYAAAYFDDRQTLIHFPGFENTFWSAWCAAQKLDSSMLILGCRTIRDVVRKLESNSASEAILYMLSEMGIQSPECRVAYLQRLSVTVLGWMSQFKYVEWQRQLGYSGRETVNSQDLLAVRLAYDYAIFELERSSKPATVSVWQASLRSWGSDQAMGKSAVAIPYVYQVAAELSYQRRVVGRFSKSARLQSSVPSAQLAFCIDVRSEMLRRNIELLDNSLQTIGFAGFFGVPIDYKKIDETEIGHRLPVLLTPGLSVNETAGSRISQLAKQTEAFLKGYYRSLRKGPLTSFVYVELFGALYILKMMRQTWRHYFGQRRGRVLPERFSDQHSQPDKTLLHPSGRSLTRDEKIDRAEMVLRHMGLTESFAELVFIVGHGSETLNNAFGSSLDCGACGGHAGDINARVLVRLLNDTSVRSGLAARHIIVPEATRFVAAVHETVTDEVFLLDEDQLPFERRPKLEQIKSGLRHASAVTRRERLSSVSPVLDAEAERRARNWSEVRPEWGLTGNACFIVAPRARTRGSNLASRAFLHDYDWLKDQQHDFKTLELIMTAPMVVTNWINMQYYSSSVAPKVFGSGNKILHNLTNESGVVEGNGGDLRVGLPLQSVHDGEKLVHDPLRLSVFIEAPRAEIEKIIARHQVVRELINNGWLYLLHIDSTTGVVSRRLEENNYIPVVNNLN